MSNSGSGEGLPTPPFLPPGGPRAPTPREVRRALALFVLTLASVFWSYGYWWAGAHPWESPEVAWHSAQFAVGMMAIFAAHEAGHYLVARRHGMDQTLPHFIPFPFAFGTLGAIIRLRSLPPNRTALLEMGAAGPLAGFAVAFVVLLLGIPGTVEHAVPEIVTDWPPPAPIPAEPGVLDGVWAALAAGLEWVSTLPPFSWWASDLDEPGVPLMIMANPGMMDVVGWVQLGRLPGGMPPCSPWASQAGPDASSPP